MPMQKVEFDFPDPDKLSATSIEVEQDVAEPRLEIEGAVGRETIGKKKKNLKVDDIEIEIVDDVPPGDRNRKPSAPPEGVTDEELESYSDKVKKRIQHFSKGYHDERRAKEQALREREELERRVAEQQHWISELRVRLWNSEAKNRDLKSLFKQLAKAFHPDLEPDPLHKQHKQIWMQRLNTA